jgi:hypothetical protein
MPRIIPQYRQKLMYELFRQIRRSKVLGPNYIRAVDRLMFLDRLATEEQFRLFTKPYEQAHKEAEVVPDDINADALEEKALLDAFNKRHYGRGDVRTEAGDSATTTDRNTDTTNKSEGC